MLVHLHVTSIALIGESVGALILACVLIVC